ncbi:MAG: hypothetical protein WBX03_14050 [Terriglobales bacterium]|jgi:hypothetical protein
MKQTLFRLAAVLCVAGVPLSMAQSAKSNSADVQPSTRRPVVYVMPNALSNPGSTDGSQVVVDSAHNGKEPQVAMIYQELQHRKECQGFSENMIKEKADYFLLLQHGGGRGNRWAVSNKSGEVIASGQSLQLGNSVKDACVEMMKNWQAGSMGE